ncbi:MAG: hypothetical protein WCO75_04240 [Planctomycetota bacterium]
MSHTPGPWKLVAGNHIQSEWGQIGRTWMMCNGDSVANAHLIAAAPELLEALKSLVDLEDGHVGVFTLDEIMDAARAAIAKAEGKS